MGFEMVSVEETGMSVLGFLFTFFMNDSMSFFFNLNGLFFVSGILDYLEGVDN